MSKSKLKIRKTTIWQAATVILAVALIYIVSTGCGASGALSADDAGDKTVDFITKVLLKNAKTAILTGVEDENNMYKVSFDIDGEVYPAYVSTDGTLLFLEPINMDTALGEAGGDIPKADKPEVELYIFSYCPAGSSSLDSFAPVGALLKDTADFKVRFFSHMHGDYERQQNKIQSCIQDVDSNKFWDYANDFFEKIYKVCSPGRDIACDEAESIKLMDEKGIDSEAVMKCVAEKGEDLYSADKQKASGMNLQYSPSFVINGQYLPNIARSPEGIKSAVCSAFNNAPAECEGSLSEQSQSAGNC